MISEINKQKWEEKTLDEVCTFSRGLTYSKKDEVDVSNNVVLRANNIDLVSNTLNLEELKYINDNILIPEDKKVKENSIIMCISSGSKSHLGKVAFIDKNYGYAFGGFMGLIIPKENIIPRFLYYMLITPAFKDRILHLTDGANINNLKYSDLKDFILNIPPLSEQQRIVGILDEVFENIEKAKQNTLQNLNNAKELFDNNLYNLFTKGTELWKKDSLHNICEKISAGGDKPEVFSETKTTECNIPIYSNGIKDNGLYGYTNKPTIDKPAITISARGTIGFVCKRLEPYCPIVRLISLIPKDYIDLSFLAYAMSFVIPKNTGTSIPQLTVPNLKNSIVKYPSLEEQQKIVQQLDELQGQTKKLEQIYTQKLQDLDELKQSILQKTFNGEL